MELGNIASADILGCRVDLLDMQESIEVITDIIERAGKAEQVVTLNAEIIYQAISQPELRRIINQARLVTADGIGTVWAARTLGYPQKERVTGIDLLLELCARAAERQWKLYLLGAAPEVALKAGQRLSELYPGLIICGCRDGYFTEADEAALIADINERKPHILFTALGAPKQEYWLGQRKESLKIPVCMGVGGSFDVIAGVKKRAPQAFIRLNLEWLYRLLSEPSRFKRQLALPAFALLVLKQKIMRK